MAKIITIKCKKISVIVLKLPRLKIYRSQCQKALNINCYCIIVKNCLHRVWLFSDKRPYDQEFIEFEVAGRRFF